MKVTRPNYIAKKYSGSFELSSEDIIAFESSLKQLFANSSTTVSVSFKDGTKNSIDNLDELDLLPIGQRSKVKSVFVTLAANNETRDSCALDFDVQFGFFTITSSCEEKTQSVILEAEKFIERLRTPYNFIYPRYGIAYWLVGFWIIPFGVTLLIERIYVNETIELITYLVSSAFMFSIPLLRYLLFDRYVFHFGAGKKREISKRKLRKFIGGGVSLATIIPIIYRAFFQN